MGQVAYENRSVCVLRWRIGAAIFQAASMIRRVFKDESISNRSEMRLQRQRHIRSSFWFSAFTVVVLSVCVTACEVVSHERLSTSFPIENAQAFTWRGVEFTSDGTSYVGIDGELIVQPATRHEALYMTLDRWSRADLFFKPVDIAEERPFTVEVLNEAEKRLMSFQYEDADDGSYVIWYDLGSLSINALEIVCRLDHAVQHREVMNVASGDNLFPAAMANSEPTSIHYVRTADGSTLIEFDYEMLQGMSTTEGSADITFPTDVTVTCSHVGFRPVIKVAENPRALRPSTMRLKGLRELRLTDLYAE